MLIVPALIRSLVPAVVLTVASAGCAEKPDPAAAPVPPAVQSSDPAKTAAAAPSAAAAKVDQESPEKKETTTMSLYDLSVNTLEGEPAKLSVYKGKVALVVNVASECGFTPQYKGLQALSEQYKGKDFVLLGFPSNDFGEQEPGDPKQIRAFCSSKFHVTFPMFEKVKTKGPGQSPVYAFLSAKNGEPKWNFHKYLVGKDGHVLAAFPSAVEPDDKALRQAIDEALAK